MSLCECDSDEIPLNMPLPGPPGPPGDPSTVPGAAGAAGKNAFTTLTSPFTQPAVNANVDATVADTSWMVVGQAVYVAVAGYFSVVTVLSGTSVRLKREAIGSYATAGTAIAASSKVSPGGFVNNDQYAALDTRVTALEAAVIPSGIQTYYQATAPTGTIATGSLWFDTDDGYRMYRWDGSGWAPATATVTVPDFGTGLKPVSILASLPVGDPDDLRLIFNTTDKKLYRFNGTSWTAAVAAGDITGTLPGGVFAANTIAAGVLQAGAVLAANIGSNLVITTAANIGSGVIVDAHIANLAASKITAGIIDSQIIQIQGSSGALQSSNFVSGSTGFRVKGDGSAEFNSVTIRGTLEAAKIRTDSQFFNSGDASRFMPGVAMVQDDVVAANGGTINISGVSTHPTFSYYTSNSLILGGWGVGSTGYSLSRIGQSNFRALVSLSGNCAPTVAGQLVYAIVWRTRTNGGAWGAWSGAGADNYADYGTVARNLQYTFPVNLSLGSGDEVQFGIRVAKNNASTAGTIGLAQLTAIAFNV